MDMSDVAYVIIKESADIRIVNRFPSNLSHLWHHCSYDSNGNPSACVPTFPASRISPIAPFAETLEIRLSKEVLIA